MSVPTPTGVLQGVAAFNWDGAAWQPAGRVAPSVPTPTGNLQGVAAFTGGPSWAPAGRAGPGVATPTGVLDGVAVYTWSGSQWTPPGGTETVPTPTGGLRGVAAFDWDGTAWQPAGQARPSVPTPYGVLDGVARFGWTGTAWAATGAPSLSLDFMTPGTLDPRITFTRASTATYTDATGTIRSAAANAPRWDYDPVTHSLRGVLIEEARTNGLQASADFSAAVWSPAGFNGPTAPVVTVNQVTAPDGTLSADRIAFPAISGAGAGSQVAQIFATTANVFSLSMWLRGNVGGEQVYLWTTDGTTYYRTLATLTTSWQRFSLVTSALTTASWYCVIGADLRDASQSSKPAQTIFAWGAQAEQGAFSTSHIPTTAATATRAADNATMPAAGWYNANTSSLAVSAIYQAVSATPQTVVSLDDGTASSFARFYRNNADQNLYAQLAGGTSYHTPLGTFSAGAMAKSALAWQIGSQSAALNGVLGAGASGALIPTGITTLRFGTLAGLTQMLCGWVRSVQYWPRVLSTTEMQQVTM